jgi:ABC-2 type transport system ATP-binding protein
MITAPNQTPTDAAAARAGEQRHRQDRLAVTARELRRTYGTFEAVRSVDLDVCRGEIFALLGPNGAGKTTTLEILEGFRDRSGGDVDVLGVDAAHGNRAWRERIGIVLQESQPQPELTAYECLSLYAGYYSAPRSVDDTLALVGLGELGNRRCDQLSGGQRRRLDVALALVGDPEMLFLDEPTTDFDPAARRAMWELVRSLRANGSTIVLTTHYREEAECLADRIAVIANGEIIAEGTPGSLGRRSLMAAEITFTVPVGVELSQLPVALGAPSIDHRGRVAVGCDDPVPAMSSLTQWALRHQYPLPDLELRRPTLEDIYLQLTAGADQ